ncbi:hypothetical protein [Burkholderia thailandensis]|uniref:hypothetical protein n=1 Tax=Burkholderia thailandensis TaxID=57975 RepID=UPI000FD63FA6|nr:hypothetical protein [Burkholderia thailandensis]
MYASLWFEFVERREAVSYRVWLEKAGSCARRGIAACACACRAAQKRCGPAFAANRYIDQCNDDNRLAGGHQPIRVGISPDAAAGISTLRKMAEKGGRAAPFDRRPGSQAERALRGAGAVRYRTGSTRCGRWSRKRRRNFISESFPTKRSLIRHESIKI